MPNGTYGGVRGRKTKVGGKLLLFSSYSISCYLLVQPGRRLPLSADLPCFALRHGPCEGALRRAFLVGSAP